MLVVRLGPVLGGCPGVVLSVLCPVTADPVSVGTVVVVLPGVDEVVPCGLWGVDDTEGVITAVCPADDPVPDPVGAVLAALLEEGAVVPGELSGVDCPGVGITAVCPCGDL